MNRFLLFIIASLFQFTFLNLSTAQVNLGSTYSFAVFTGAGQFSNDGATVITGDIGTDVGAFSGFPPGIVNGTIHVTDAVSTQAAIDVDLAYAELAGTTCGLVLGTSLGNGQLLTPNIYCLGAAATINGNLILDGQNDPNAVFIFQIDGALATSVTSQVTLINGASLCNIYWQVNGAVTLGDFSFFRGTIIANGAIHILEGATLFGRALSRVGAIDLHNNQIMLGLPAEPAIIIASGPTDLCPGGSVVLSGNTDGVWNTGETTPSIIVTTPGDYFVTTTTICGSAVSNIITVTLNPAPVCTITGSTAVCQGQTTQLCASPGMAGYMWSTGATSACINVNTAGIYGVTITDSNGCTSTCSTTVNVNPLPVCTVTGNDMLCQGQTTQLCAPAGATSYLWNTGAITNCINVNTAGTFTVTVTNASGCSSICSRTVTLNPLPICTITGNNTICQGQSTQLCTPAGAASYLWSTGAITNCINVNLSGIYTVTVTSSSGCSSVCSREVFVNPLPVCTITGNDIICEGQSTQLCTPAGAASYLWSTGANTNCIDVNLAGTYTVTVTSINGCSSVCSRTVTLNPAPICTITGNNIICEGQSTQLCTPAGAASYLWSTGASTNCINVNQAGIYTVTVTNASGCSSVCSREVTLNPLPICTITGNDIICQGQSTQLCTPAGAASYLWSTGANTNCIEVNLAGTYTVTVTNANGCSSVCSRAVTLNPLPICTITGNNIICEGQSTQLCTPAGAASYLWSTGANTNCIDVNQAGIYTVTVTNASGCSSVCSREVTLNPLPICTITGNDIICQGQSTQLCTPAGAASYLWSTGAITNCINVNLAGTYTVTVTNANGCSSVCSRTVILNPLPVCTITGEDFICQEGQTTQLCTPAGAAAYLWNTGEITNCILVSTAGTYTVTVTNAGGCTSVCSKLVTITQQPVCTITGEDFICQEGQSTQLCVPPGAPAYLWSTGAFTNCITVNAAGTYSVTITNAGGCTSVCSKTVLVDPQPVCTITGNEFICEGQLTELCTPVGAAAYLWSTGDITNCINVNMAGTYFVTVTYTSGCTSVCSKTVVLNPLPVCLITGDNFICQPGQTTELCVPPGAASYLWSTGDNTNCITVNAAGLYSVTITNSNGCTSVCSEEVTVNPPPACIITGDNFICQPGQTTQLCVPPGAESYLWSTGDNTNCITVNAAGIYTVTITYASGCTSVCSEEVTVNPPPVCQITGDNFICQPGQTTQLCVPPGAESYLWSTGDNTNCILVNAAGIYTVTITYAGGCTSVCSEEVTVNPPPVCIITGDNFICQPGQTTELCVLPGAESYLWNTGDNTNCIIVNAAGIYTVTITYAGGCTSVCSEEVTVNPPPVCIITGDNFICQPGQTTQLCVLPGAESYLWNTGDNTNCILVSAAGIYTVTITYAGGCISVCSEEVTVNPPPACQITGNDLLCQPGQTTELCVPPGAESYLWSTGDNTNCITVSNAGTYAVTITYSNGCTSVCSKTIIVNPLSNCTITGEDILCEEGQTTELCVPAGAASYEWSTGETTNCITVSNAGNYAVTITNSDGCTSVCSKTVTSDVIICYITCSSAICEGQTAILCAPYGYDSYLWSNGDTTCCITVNIGGTYFVTITNANGCTSTCSMEVITTPLPDCFITGADYICQDGQPTQLCVASGADFYLWSTGDTTNCINVFASGTYFVTVTNANGCTSTCSKTISGLLLTTFIENGDCDNANGTASVSVFGGTPPYTYIWSNGGTTETISGLPAGTYTVTVTDANGCFATATVTLISPIKIGNFVWHDLNEDGLQNFGEPGIEDVLVILTGTTQSGGNVNQTQHTDANGMYMFNNLQPGTYNLEFTEIPDDLDFTTQNVGSNDAIDSDPNAQSGIVSNIIAVQGGCYLDYDAGLKSPCVDIIDPGSIGGDEFLCGPGIDGSEIISVTLPTGGTGAIFYMWMFAYTLEDFNSSSWNLIPGANGPSYDPGLIYQTTYYVRCTFSEGCTIILESNIVVKIVGDDVDAQVLSADEVCVNEPVTFTAPDNGPGAVYTWNFGPSANPQFAYTQVATTTFEYWGYPVVHVTVQQGGCIASNFKQVYVGCVPGVMSVPVANIFNLNKVAVSWQVSNEGTQSTYFVERSADRIQFEIVGMVTGLANNQVVNEYQFIDDQPLSGRSYYRIRQSSDQQVIQYSDIAEVFMGSNNSGFLLYPNPVDEVFIVEVLETYQSGLTVQLYNAAGQFINSFHYSNEVNKPEVSMAGLPGGIYTIRILYDDRVSSQKMLKL
jgi:hypothetical protein